MFIRNLHFRAHLLAAICALLLPAMSAGAFDVPLLTSVGVVRPHNNSWMIYESDNFRAYVRDKRFAKIAKKTLSILESSRAEFKLKIGFVSEEKISVFLYKSMNDYRGSNIGQGYLSQSEAGFDDPIKFRLGFPMNKSSRNHRWALRRRLMSLYFFQNLFGDSKSVTRFVMLAWRSQWINEGLGGLFGGVNLPILKMITRDAIEHENVFDMGQLHWFSYLKPEEQMLAEAQSISLFHYISGLVDAGEMKNMFLDYRHGYSNNDYLKKYTGMVGTSLFSSWVEDEKNKMATRDKPDSFSQRLTPETERIASFTSPRAIPGSEDFVSISNVDLQPEIYRFSKTGNEWRKERLIGWNRLLSVTRIRQNGSPLNVSQDGRYLFFFGDYGADEYLFRIDLDNGQLSSFEIPTDDAYSPSVSPDGTKIVFTGIKNGAVDLYIWQYETGGLRQLTATPEDEGYAAWSPDGKMIAYALETGGQWDLWVIEPEGINSRRLTHSARDELQPVWGEKEGELLFSASGIDGYQLHSINVHSGISKAITNTQGGAFRPAPFKGGILYEQYENIRSSVRFISKPPLAFSEPAPALPQSSTKEAEVEVKESVYESLFTSNYSLPVILASAGDEASNNEAIWVFGIKTGIVSQGVSVGGSRAFFVPQASIRYVNKFNRFDISGNLFYQSRDLAEDDNDNNKDASDSSFREREKYGGNIGISFSPTKNITLGVGYTGFHVNKRQLINDDYKDYFDSGVYAQLSINHILRYNLYPEYGYSLKMQYASINEILGADNNYGVYHNNVQGYFPIFEKVVAGIDLNYDFSDGEFPTYFDLGWQNGLKGIELNKYEGTHRFTAMATLERPIILDSRVAVAYSTLRDMRVILFADMGTVADTSPFDQSMNTYKKSVGIHLRMDIYWLQAFGVPIGIYYASEVDSDNPDSILSITAGSDF